MKNLAVWPWRINEDGPENSKAVTVKDADGWDLCQVFQYRNRPKEQVIEHAVLFAASRTMLQMIEDSDGTNDKAVMNSLRDLVGMCKRRAAGYNRPDKRAVSPNKI